MPQAVLPAAIAAGASIYGAQQQSKAAKKAAKQATPIPYSVFGPGGSFGVDPKTKQLTLAYGNNPFSNLMQALGLNQLRSANGAQDRFLYGANPEVAAAYQGMFGQGLTNGIQSQLDLLRQAAAPEENRQRLGLDDQLYARGMLGTSGGAERYRALMEAQNQADLQRQLSAVGLGNQEAINRFQAALGAVGQGQSAQQQQYNMGSGAFGSLFSQLMGQANAGLGAASGTPAGIAQYAAQASGAPYQAGFNFLNNSGLFNALGGGPANSTYGYGVPGFGIGTGGPVSVTAPNPSSWMPSGNFGL